MQEKKVAQTSHQQSNHESDPQVAQKLPTQLLMESAKNGALLPVKSLSYLESKSCDCHLNKNGGVGEEYKVQSTELKCRYISLYGTLYIFIGCVLPAQGSVHTMG